MTIRLAIHPPSGPAQGRSLGGDQAGAYGGSGAIPAGGAGESHWRGSRQMMGRPTEGSRQAGIPALEPGLILLPGTAQDPFGDHRGEGSARASRQSRKGNPDRPEPPEWCRSFYRPRMLSEQGVQIMRDLDPAGRGTAFPLGYGDPNEGLQARMDYLARRHTALDLMRKGEAFSVGGYYAHISRLPDAGRLLKEWYQKMPSGGPGIDREELLQWLGLYRRPSLEQILALAPAGMRDTWDELDQMATEGMLQMSHVEMGKGRLETVALTPKGWKKMLETHEDAKAWGWGPRRPLPQNREFHEQVVGDAVSYALHELDTMTAKPIGVLLDPALRRLYLGAPYVPDLRLDFEDRLGVPGHYLMEVEGRGSDYRGRGHREKMDSAGMFRAFSTRGATAGGGGGRVSITR